MSLIHKFWANLYRCTPAELAIEPAVAALGIPYRTQFPLFLWGTRIFPDFAFPTIGVVLEIDDDSHLLPEKQEADRHKTEVLAGLGYHVVRCSNEEALNDPEGTVERLVRPLLHRKGPGLPRPKERQQFRTKSKNKRK